VLQDIDFHSESTAEAVGIIGINGAGKKQTLPDDHWLPPRPTPLAGSGTHLPSCCGDA